MQYCNSFYLSGKRELKNLISSESYIRNISNAHEVVVEVAPKLKHKSNSNKQTNCNCRKSKCLKLYCECFVSGEVCVDCNCQNCHNIDGGEERSKAI